MSMIGQEDSVNTDIFCFHLSDWVRRLSGYSCNNQAILTSFVFILMIGREGSVDTHIIIRQY